MPVVAALIVSFGALIGILIGANYAADRVSAQIFENRRLFEDQLEENRVLFKEQLIAEAERVQMQLDAAETRLGQQLREERIRQDRAELLGTLDAGAELLAQTASKLINGGLAMQKAREGDWSERDKEDSQVLAATVRLETFETLTYFWRRLLIRFQLRDPIPKAFKTATDAYTAAMRSLSEAFEERDSEQLGTFEKEHEKFRKGYVDFLTKCRQRVGVSDE
jgi:hypothetical protein